MFRVFTPLAFRFFAALLLFAMPFDLLLMPCCRFAFRMIIDAIYAMSFIIYYALIMPPLFDAELAAIR